MMGSEVSPRQPEWESSRCYRCGGLTVVEEFLDDNEILALGESFASRCVNCGNLVDQVILHNQAKAF